MNWSPIARLSAAFSLLLLGAILVLTTPPPPPRPVAGSYASGLYTGP